MGYRIGNVTGALERDARSLDYSSYTVYNLLEKYDADYFLFLWATRGVGLCV